MQTEAERIAAGLLSIERKWIKAVRHDDVADDAGMIAWRAGDRAGGGFAYFARKNQAIVERCRDYADTKFVYKLTPLAIIPFGQVSLDSGRGGDMKEEWGASRLTSLPLAFSSVDRWSGCLFSSLGILSWPLLTSTSLRVVR